MIWCEWLLVSVVTRSDWSPPPSVGSSPPELHSGSKATLQCVVNTGKPLSPEPTVQWIRPDGVPHPAKGPAHLYPVTASDSGVWVCSFLYEGRTYNSSLHVRVKGAVQQLCRVFDFCGPGEEVAEFLVFVFSPHHNHISAPRRSEGPDEDSMQQLCVLCLYSLIYINGKVLCSFKFDFLSASDAVLSSTRIH